MNHSWNAHAKSSLRSARRKGGAFLVLVVALLIVVLAASQSMLRGEIASQRNHRSRMQVDTLQRAIAANRKTMIEKADSGKQVSDSIGDIVLALDGDQSIVILIDDAKQTVTAKWLRGSTIETSIVRPLTVTNENSNSNVEDE